MTDPLAEIPRDRWGRPLVAPPEGGKAKAYTRCTTYVGVLEDTYNLAKWQQRMVAIGLSERPDLLLAVNAASRDDKDTLDDLCERATEAAKAHAGATIGTALHSLTERMDRGEDVGEVVPVEYRADLAAYRNATRPLTATHIEQFCVLDDLRVGGTPDRVVRYHGQHYIADLKTGNIDYGLNKIAMQLAVYSRCVAYDHMTETRTPLPDVDQERALIIHLPAGKGECELVWVDIAAGWEAVQLATQVRDWRSRKGLSTPFEDEPPMGTNVWAPPDAADPLAETIIAITDLETLRELWRARAGTPEWTEEHSTLAKARAVNLSGAA